MGWYVWLGNSKDNLSADRRVLGYFFLTFGLALYGLLNWSYTVAVFTDPGSPLSPPSSKQSSGHAYSHLPTHELARNSDITSLTVKSTGETRFCKKCQTRKPDRAHHCSTCGRCVLKMDHHCPWLATCVGLRNYKAFLLFCSYVTLFCWVCFGVSSTSVWDEIMDKALARDGELFSVNVVLLAVLAGIFGLVLFGFTGWHVSLAVRNQTTIECLEKTRYLSPIRRTMNRAAHTFAGNGQDRSLVHKYGQQLTEIHANALPGITRAEEGGGLSPQEADPREPLTAAEALRINYNDLERERERQRYESYLDEKDSEKLPNAFDMGWKRNLVALFGESPLLWLLPVCNTLGDGWHWEPNPKWTAAREALRQARESQRRDQDRVEQGNSGSCDSHSYSSPFTGEAGRRYLSTPSGIASGPGGPRSLETANRLLSQNPENSTDEGYFGFDSGETELQMKRIGRNDRSDEASSLDGLYDRDEVLVQESLDDGDRGPNDTSRGLLSHNNWRDWD